MVDTVIKSLEMVFEEIRLQEETQYELLETGKYIQYLYYFKE